jgi:uncharacterized protein
MEGMPATTLAAIAGLAIGLIVGATAHVTNFCTMGAVSDMVLMDDNRRLRAWVLAIAVGILGSQALHVAGAVDLDKSVYLTANFGWLGSIVGGLLLGFGMTQCGGCPSRTLVRLGAGNLKSVVVFLVLAVFSYMTMRGLIAAGRIQVESAVNIDLAARGLKTQGVPDLAAAALGLGAEAARLAAVALIAGGMLWFCFKDAAFRGSRRNIAAGLIIGLMVPAGWYATGVFAYDEFQPIPLASLTFVAPVGDTLQYLMIYTGATINFGVGTVSGVIAGSLLAAVITGTFSLESFVDRDDLVRHMSGAALMGIGGVTALGCTFGQGITGMSTLALGSIIAWLSIIAGGVLGMKYLEAGTLGGAVKAVFERG